MMKMKMLNLKEILKLIIIKFLIINKKYFLKYNAY